MARPSPAHTREFIVATLEYSYKHGVESAAMNAGVNERTIRRWRNAYGGEHAREIWEAEKKEKAQAEAAPNQLEMENADLRVWVERLEAENTDLLARVERLETENTDLQAERQQHKKTIAALKNALAVLASVQ